MANTQVTGDLIADGAITAAKLSNVTTDTISEGTALYYTDARVASYLSANSYATEGYVTTAVNNLIDAAPASLDTLNELAAALNDDANFATTVTNALATKLNLSGGNITGNLSVDTNVLFVDTVNDRVGIGTSSPAVKLHVAGGNIKLDNGYGIDFSASAGGGATSSLLDDYEEGTWTPAIISGYTAITYSAQVGKYTKIGDVVSFRLGIAITAATADANRLKITLPTIVGQSTAASIGFSNISGLSTTDTPFIVVEATTDLLEFYLPDGSGGSFTGNSANDTSWALTISGTYFV